MDITCNYPPQEILKAPLGRSHPNYEYIILWMVNNNEACTWSNLQVNKIVSRSTLSIYLKKLIKRGYIEKSEFNQYRITPKGKIIYYDLSLDRKTKRRLSYPPKVILARRNYDHWILWMVYNNNFLKWSDFLDDTTPVFINQSSLSKNLNELKEKGFVRKEAKEYRITQAGKSEYSSMLSHYNLDRQSILEEESKRIKEITKKTIKFFEKFKIKDDEIRFRFLNNVLKLPFTVLKSMDNEDDYNKIMLFLSINHPNQYPDYISLEFFAKKYNIEQVILNFHILHIVDKNKYPVKFFKLEVVPDKTYYLQVNEKLERMLNVIVEDHITRLTYLNKLYEESSKGTSPLTMESTVNAILDEICDNLFHTDLRTALMKFLPDYINYLAYKIEKERKLLDTFDKLEGLIWQEVQASNLSNPKAPIIGQNEANYYLDPVILEVLEPYYASLLGSIYKTAQPLMEKKDYNKTLKIVNSAIKTNQKKISLIIFKAVILCYLNRNLDAIEFLNKNVDLLKVTEKPQLYASYHFTLAFSSMTLGNFEYALDITNKVLSALPEHPLSFALKGLILGYNCIHKFNREKSEKDYGLNELDNAINLESTETNKARYYQLKSQILLELKRREDAIDAIDSAIDLTPGKFDLYHSKNRILIYYDQYNDILMLLDKMLKKFPENEKDLRLKKASILKKTKNVLAGLEIIDKLIEKYPEDNDLINYKAVWLQYLNRKEEALKMIKELIERVPEIGVYHDTYGEILMFFREYEAAVKEFQKAMELSSYEWFIYQTYIKLGICYKELGDYELAVENLKKGKELTNKYLIDIDTKRQWLTIAELFLAEIAQLETEF